MREPSGLLALASGLARRLVAILAGPDGVAEWLRIVQLHCQSHDGDKTSRMRTRGLGSLAGSSLPPAMRRPRLLCLQSLWL